jgi:hypothetical protein
LLRGRLSLETLLFLSASCPWPSRLGHSPLSFHRTLGFPHPSPDHLPLFPLLSCNWSF